MNGTMWAMLLLAASLELAGDLLLKWWAETDRWLAMGLGLVVYGLALILFATMLRRADLSVIFVLWTGVAAVLLTVVGWWLFGEQPTVRRLAGIALVIGGIWVLGE